MKAAPLPSVTIGALIGLAAGLAAGIAVHAAGVPALVSIAAGLGTVGDLWTNALRLLVIPLVVANLLLGIAATEDARAVGRLGVMSLAIFAGMLALGAGFALVLTPPLLAGFSAGPATVAALRAAAPGIAAASEAAPTFREWLISLIPSNLFRAAVDEQVLPLVVVTVGFGLAVTRLAPERRRTLLDLARALLDALFVALGWVLRASPLGVFALAFALAARTGAESVGTFGVWVALVCGLMLAFTALLYPLTAVLARVPLGRFARAVIPAQTVAIGTRSSLASLPALLEGAEHGLGLTPAVAGFALPLAVSTFKVNRTLSSVAKLLFLAALYHMQLDPLRVAGFVLTVGTLSFATPGIPSAGSVASLPAYLACGIPIQGVVLLNAVEAVPDIFKTLLNVTSDLSAAAILARFAGAVPHAARAAAPLSPVGALPEEVSAP